jgi:hypothetical protein
MRRRVPKMAGKPRLIRKNVKLATSEIAVYASPKMGAALDEVLSSMDLYHGVRLAQVLEAVYGQGKRDGARAALESLDASVAALKSKIPHRNPGRPKKS